MKQLGTVAALAALGLGLGVAGSAGAGVITDFENGTTDGWTQGSDTTVTLTPVAGGSQGSNFALRVDRTSGNWNQSMMTGLSAGEWADVAAGTTFTIDIKAQGGPGADVPGWWLQLFPTLNSGSGGWDQSGALEVVLDGQWRTYTWTYPDQVEPTGGWSELFLVNQGGASPNMTFYIDNLGIVPIPEPGSLALLGIVGLALARHRRC